MDFISLDSPSFTSGLAVVIAENVPAIAAANALPRKPLF